MAEWHSGRSDCQLVVDCSGIGATEPFVGIGNQPAKADAGHLGRARAVVLAMLSRRAEQPDDFFPAATSTGDGGLDQQRSIAETPLLDGGQSLYSSKHGAGAGGVAGEG